MAKPEGQTICASSRQCDVLIENYKFGDLQGYGLDYDDLKTINPPHLLLGHRLRPDRPLCQRPGYDFMIQGMGGLMTSPASATSRRAAGRRRPASPSPTS